MSLLIASFVSMIGIFCIPFLRKTLHPLEILTCGLLVASLDQFSYAILTLNLEFIKASENPYEFWALKLEQIFIAPVLILLGVFVFFSESLRPLGKAFILTGFVFLLLAVTYCYDRSGIIQFVKWRWSSEWLRDAALLAVSIGFLMLFRKFLKWQGVSRDPVSSDSL